MQLKNSLVPKCAEEYNQYTMVKILEHFGSAEEEYASKYLQNISSAKALSKF